MAQYENVRRPAAAGMFYENDPETLETSIKGYLSKAHPEQLSAPVIALISPHAGYPFSGQAAAFGFKLLDSERTHRVFVIAPSHRMHFRGVSIPPVEAYETPLGLIPLNQEVCDTLLTHNTLFSSVSQAHLQEHSLEVQLPFLQVVLKNFEIVPMVVGQVKNPDSENIAKTLRGLIKEDDVVVASSDFTHQGPRFGYVPYRENVKKNIRDLDMGAVDRILKKSSQEFVRYVEDTEATICGSHPISILLDMLPKEAKGSLLIYYTSGDVLGDETDTVSYASIAFENAAGWG